MTSDALKDSPGYWLADLHVLGSEDPGWPLNYRLVSLFKFIITVCPSDGFSPFSSLTLVMPYFCSVCLSARGNNETI